MTHTDEASFQDAVREWLERWYRQVDAEPELNSDRRPDFVARGPFHVLVVEVEDTFEGAYEGAGQALSYAAELRETVPDDHRVEAAVLLPRDHVDDPELHYLRQHVRVATVPTPDHP